MNAAEPTRSAWLDAMYRYLGAESYRTKDLAGNAPAAAPAARVDLGTVAAVMTPDPISVRLTTPYKEVASLLRDNDISAVPVLNAFREPVGVASEADLIAKHTYRPGQRKPFRFARKSYARWRKARARCAKDLMTSPVQTIDANVSLREAAEKLIDGNARRLFVTSDGLLTGVLARRDLLRVFVTSDEDLLTAVNERIARHRPWTNATEVCATVSLGVVTLLGSVPRRSDARRLGELASSVPGVVAVRNRLGHDVDDVRASATTST
ncbi:CBS domain-containing protein [Haloechinothrix salitolerans]|uniref:CBS domain-containing protein n=1 Tax=Haloechinothrix salitolerans TaxID=926830 RepID=A0ABW2C8H5_9PSEU